MIGSSSAPERAEISISAVRLRWLKLILACALAVLAIVRTVGNVRNDSMRDSQFDFRTYYAWSLEYRLGEQLWAPAEAHGDIRPGIERISGCNYTPFFIKLITPLSLLDRWTAHQVWEFIQIVCFTAALLILARGTDPPLDLVAATILISLGLLSRGFRVLLYFGQCSPLMLLPVIGSWYYGRRRHNLPAGLFLAIAILLKLYPAAIGGYYFFRRQWQALGWTLAFIAGGVLLSGARDWSSFLRYGLGHSSPWVTRFSGDRISALNLVWGLVTAAGASASTSMAWVLTITFVISLILLILLARTTWLAYPFAESDDMLKAGPATDDVVFGAWITLAVLLSPISWNHELLLLFPLYYFAALIIVRVVITIYLPQLRECLGLAARTSPAPLTRILLLISAVLFAGCIAAEFTRVRRLMPTAAIPMIAFAAAELLIVSRLHTAASTRA